MKRLLTVVFLALFLTACSAQGTPDNQNNSDNPPVSESPVISDYFPLKPDTLMDYEGIGNEFAEQTVYTDFIKDNTVQLRVANPGTTMARVYKIENGELRMVYSKEEYYYINDFTASDSAGEILLKEPLKAGTEWTLPDGARRYIADIEAQAVTPSGTYQALAVVTEWKDSVLRQYYAKDIGLVLTEFESDGQVVKTSLKELRADVANEINVRFYYPDFDSGKLAYTTKKLSYRTNPSIIPFFEESFKKAPNSKLTNVMSSGAKINSMGIDTAKNLAIIDLSQQFLTEMNAGSSLEGMLIQSIVNTLGEFYGVQNVAITLDGKPYESGHFSLSDGSSFKTDFDKTYELT